MNPGAAAFLLSVALAGARPLPEPLPPTARVEGKRVSDFPALWWQWADAKRWGARPYQDPSGAQCGLNQAGKVWFLAGTDGTESVQRRCRVPTDRYLFLPVIAMLESAAPGVPRTCEQVKQAAAANNEHLARVTVTLDGRPIDVRSLRMASECFNSKLRAQDVEKTEGWFPAATDGFWLMLAPLPPGEHVLVVSARYDNPGKPYGDLEQDFSYTLEISDAAGEADQDDDEDDGQDADGSASPWQGTRV